MRAWRSASGIVFACLLLAGAASAQSRRTAGYAWDNPNWRFSVHSRPVKVVLLAGSIGAFRDRPYGALIHQWCERAEIRNVSRVGMGAPQLFTHFQDAVLGNPNVPVGARNTETWLLFGGGLNSVGLPSRTNYAMHRLFRLAHRRDFHVVALTLTPWGADGTRDERWAGARGLHAMQSTRRVVDYVMGRLTPEEALGPFANRRPRGVALSAPWTSSERPDVAIELYDSALRDRGAAPWPIERTRAMLREDRRYRSSHASLSAPARAAQLDADAQILSDAPRWFLRPEYRGFDHIHPNRQGHEAMARAMCPSLPESWGCSCP